MVVEAPSGVCTELSSADAAEVPWTYCLSDTTVRVPGVVCLITGSITADSVSAGLTEKYSMPVPVPSPSDTVTSTLALPDAIEPVSNTNCPSALMESAT